MAVLLIQDRWQDIADISITPFVAPNPPTIIRDWINRYFETNEFGLDSFHAKDDILGLQLRSPDRQRGYVFHYPLQVRPQFRNSKLNFEDRMNMSLRLYSAGGTSIRRKFVDYENVLAGFSWEAKRHG